MKTEKEFSDHFVTVFEQNASAETKAALRPLGVIHQAGEPRPLPPRAQPHAIAELSKTAWSDLTSHLSFYFSNEDRWLILAEAARQLAQRMTTQKQTAAWPEVLRDFNEKNYWNFSPVYQKPKVAPSEDQKVFQKLFKYGWAFFQSMIILKIAVYYFGLESAERPDQVNPIWVWFFFSLSVGSLIFFAYRNRKDLD